MFRYMDYNMLSRFHFTYGLNFLLTFEVIQIILKEKAL